MKRHYLVFAGLLTLLVVSSCAVKVQNAYQLEDRGDNRNNNPTNDVYITTAFIGDAIDFITFQVDIDNQSDENVSISTSNVVFLMDLGGTRRRFAQPVFKYDIIRTLTNEKELLESERKMANTTTAVLGGLDVLAGVLTGAGTAESVLRGGDYAVEAVDRSQRYKLAQQSVEEELAYHEEFSLDKANLPPGTKASFDIHFKPPMLDAYGEIEIRCADHIYDFPYQLEVVKEKNQR